MKRIMLVFGTRPEAIKMAPVIKAIEEDKVLTPIVVVTAQHRDMLDTVLSTFKIKPDYDLNIMKQNQSLSEITAHAMTKLEEIIKEEKPDLVLVHGDTTTTFSASLAAYYNKVPVGHVEAGLRTFNKYAPFPEEINRQLVGNIAELHFAPTQAAADNLLKENKRKDKVFITGNTAIDTLNLTINDAYKPEVLDTYGDKRFILLTVHRRENLGKPMIHIFKAINKIVETHPDVHVIFPVHKNPAIRALANEYFNGVENVHCIEPLDVVDFHNIANKAHVILTDSGGVQEEAPSLNRPVLVLREVTERPEGVKAGTLKVIGTDEKDVFNETSLLLEDTSLYKKMSHAKNPYGDGKASKRICEAIKFYFNLVSNKPQDFI